MRGRVDSMITPPPRGRLRAACYNARRSGSGVRGAVSSGRMSAATMKRPRGMAGRVAAALRWTPCGARARTLTFIGLCALALATLIALYQVPYRHTVLIGARDAAAVRGFYDPEGKGD